MFANCSGMTTAPVLPAATIPAYGYRYMFRYCRHLNYIKCLATSLGSNACAGWTQNVAATGTFVKASGSTWTTGSNGIPTGWVVEDEITPPAWPKNYFYPTYYDTAWGIRGLGFWINPISDGTAFNINFASDDCEGEGGDKEYSLSKSVNWRIIDNPSMYTVTATTGNGNLWFYVGSRYDAIYNRRSDGYGSVWNYCTALCLRHQDGSCGSSIDLPTGVSYNNIELLVNASPIDSDDYYFNHLVTGCTNLKYIALNSEGTYTGKTYDLRNSAAWTYESMQFTEWYCPGTTFIIENNSWWRQRIDWDIADKRNITFKDSNGNIIQR